jgi:hypothetical protein
LSHRRSSHHAKFKGYNIEKQMKGVGVRRGTRFEADYTYSRKADCFPYGHDFEPISESMTICSVCGHVKVVGDK